MENLFGLSEDEGEDESGQAFEYESYENVEYESRTVYGDGSPDDCELYYDDVPIEGESVKMAWKKWNRVYLLTDVNGRRGMTALVIEVSMLAIRGGHADDGGGGFVLTKQIYL